MNDTPFERPTAQDEAAHSGDMIAENIARLKAIFPQVLTDGKIDFEVLRAILGDEVETGEERYGLNWKGKQAARAFALTPSLGTLRPARDDSVDWESTQNIVIEGDNLEVLKLLRRSYAGKVKLIYIDPPYNTGNAMLYPNDFSQPLRTYEQFAGNMQDGVRLNSNPKTGGRFHAEWLQRVYPALMMGRELLDDDGVLVLAIDDNEVASCILLLQEVFGEGAHSVVPVTVIHNPRGVQGKNFSAVHEYAIFVFRSSAKVIREKLIPSDEVEWVQFRNWGGESLRTDARNCFFPVLIRDGEIIGFGDVSESGYHPPKQTVKENDISYVYPIDQQGIERKWRYARQSVDEVASNLRAEPTAYGYEIKIGKGTRLQTTLWNDKRYDASVYGAQLVNQIFECEAFSFPKSLYLVQDIVAATTLGGDIVLDFFAGSGTTGHAVMAQNAADGGQRRYILVQLPEPLDPEKKEQKVAADFCDKIGRPRNIAELTKERLRRAGRKLKEENPGKEFDTGFRVYKLATSNLRPWNPPADASTEALQLALEDGVDNILPGRTEEDLLTELLLKTGIDLTLPTETREIAGKTVHALGGGTLIVCLAQVSDGDAEPLAHGIADWRRDLSPPAASAFWFKDAGFASAAAKANLVAILKQRLAPTDITRIAAI